MLFSIGFESSHIIVRLPQFFQNPFISYIMDYSIIALTLIIPAICISKFGYKKIISAFLISFIKFEIIGEFHFESTLDNILDSIEGVMAIYSLIGSICFASVACPVRVRASGLGLILGIGTLGSVCGLFIERKFDWIFIFAPLLGILGDRKSVV